MVRHAGKSQVSAKAGFTPYDSLCLKGLAILLMLMHHCFLGPERYTGQIVDFQPFSENLINRVALSFKICVAMFVFISGYGITSSYRRKFAGEPTARQVSTMTAARLVKMIGGYLFIFLLAQLWSLAVVRDGRYLKVYGEGILGVFHFVVDALGLAELLRTPTFLATFWYMSLATLIVILVPVLHRFAEKFGYGITFALAIYLRVLFDPNAGPTYANLPNYLACVVTGMWAADTNAVGRFLEWRPFGLNQHASKALRLTGCLVLGALSLLLRQKTRYMPILPFWDSVIPLLTCFILCDAVDKIPLVNTVLAYLGKHSMNIFLVHNFVRVMWYYDFTYSLQKWWLIILVLLGVSLAISEIIQLLKRVTGYDAALGRLHAHILEQDQS